jgi:putative hydrolase of the HAD superfamily
MVKFIFFDVAGTLLFKPDVLKKMHSVIESHGYEIEFSELNLRHKLLSEIIKFPDRTNEAFYSDFNAKLLNLLAIPATEKILSEIFLACKNLPWERFSDTDIVTKLNVPIGIISNFNSSLSTLLKQHFGDVFSRIVVSEDVGYAKPDYRIFKEAIDSIDFDSKEIIYVGDSYSLDIFPLEEMGVKALLIDRDGVYPYCNMKISNLAELLSYVL